MKATEIQAEKREVSGTRPCQKLRAGGNIPAIIYGGGKDTVLVQFSTLDLEKTLAEKPEALDVKIGGKSEKVLVKEVQMDTFRDYILHVDLLRV